jgi:sarcosine oxidase
MTDLVKTKVLVLGLGAVGAAVAYQLSRRKVEFIGLEQQPPPPYAHGSSVGETRITRIAVGEGEDYAPLVRRSHEIWRELEAAGAPELFRRCGVLYLAYGPGGGKRHGVGAFLKATRDVAKAQRVRLRRFDADTLCDRYPQFQVPPKTVAYLEADAGYVWPQRCIKAQLDAVADQSRLRFGETVLERSQVGGRVRIRTNLATYEAERAVVAMGAWIPGFIGGPFQRDMRVLRQTLHWFRADEPELWRGEAAPVFLWFHGPRAADVFYGFPLTRGGRPGVKVATEQYAVETAPDDLVRAVSAAESDAMFREHVAGRLRGVSSEPVAAEACLYTYNQGQGQDGRFRIGPDPDAPASLVVSACSGHGFKHSAGLGEAIVRDLCGEAPLCDLSVFGPAA